MQCAGGALEVEVKPWPVWLRVRASVCGPEVEVTQGSLISFLLSSRLIDRPHPALSPGMEALTESLLGVPISSLRSAPSDQLPLQPGSVKVPFLQEQFQLLWAQRD